MWYVHIKEYFAAIKRNWGYSKCSNTEVQKLQYAKHHLEKILLFIFEGINVNTYAGT